MYLVLSIPWYFHVPVMKTPHKITKCHDAWHRLSFLGQLAESPSQQTLRVVHRWDFSLRMISSSSTALLFCDEMSSLWRRTNSTLRASTSLTCRPSTCLSSLLVLEKRQHYSWMHCTNRLWSVHNTVVNIFLSCQQFCSCYYLIIPFTRQLPTSTSYASQSHRVLQVAHRRELTSFVRVLMSWMRWL